MTKLTLAEHLYNPTPKRILSLDGGGVRGALTLGYLTRVEQLLQDRYKDKEFRLCDYFDLIGGTSTGAIIASGLAIGMSVAEIKDHYFKLGKKIFPKQGILKGTFNKVISAEYDEKPLENELKGIFGDIKLGSPEIKTGLCLVAKRADTNSIWPLINHPDGKFYGEENGNNKEIYLWQAIRASSAAPTYFRPIFIDVENGTKGAFIDGGVSTENNPSVTLLKVATFKGFPFKWEKGENKMYMLSLGTGYSTLQKTTSQLSKAWLMTWAKKVPDLIMQDSSMQNEILMQWISNPLTSKEFDSEIGDLKGDKLYNENILTYARYNTLLDNNNLKAVLNKDFTNKDLEDFQEMSHAENIADLYKVGFYYAEKLINNETFPHHFD